MLLRILIFTLFLTMTTFSQIPPIETGVPQTLAKWRAANYRDVRYKLNLTLEKMSPVLKGTIEVSLKNNADRIVLDWRKIRGKEDASTVTNASVNGKAAKFEEINEHLIFKENVVQGENVVKLDFTSPIATSGAAITRYVDKEDGAEYVYSLFVPSDASTAFPVFDQPDLKARFQLNVWTSNEENKDWNVISNGKLAAKKSSDYFRPLDLPANQIGHWSATFYAFEETKPISTYVFAFAAGDFAEFEDKESLIPGKLYVRKSQAAKLGNANSRSADGSSASSATARETPLPSSGAETTQATSLRSVGGRAVHAPIEEVFRLNREAVKYLESYFDYKFPFPKYDLVLIPEFPFGGMEHAGATFLRESSIIFPSEPTGGDFISRANLIFHEAAHQWFGDTVTMRWFDDLWLKEGFAEFMAYKTLEKVLPEYNAWKAFYERNKPLAYQTDSTRGTTPIYQEIPNLSAAKSAYGNIVYRKAPSFLRQAEFYLGADKFQTAVRAFLRKHEYANAEWTDLVKEFETSSKLDLKDWANVWVKKRGLPVFRRSGYIGGIERHTLAQSNLLGDEHLWKHKLRVLLVDTDKKTKILDVETKEEYIKNKSTLFVNDYGTFLYASPPTHPLLVFPNYQDYGYGIFLLDERSRDYVLKNIQNEKDDFLRSMMWGTLWDSVREAELSPADYVALAVKNVGTERDELTIQTILNRVGTAMNYYLSDAQARSLAAPLENVLIERMRSAPTLGLRITFYRAFLNTASGENARAVLKDVLNGKFGIKGLNCRGEACPRPLNDRRQSRNGQGQAQPLQIPPNVSNNKNASLLKTKDKFDIVTKLLILGDKDAPNLLAELEKTENSDEAKRYAYAARAGTATAENKAKFWNDFTADKEISESWIEAAFAPFNSPRHSELTLPYLERALLELPNLKRSRKIFFVNGWLGAFVGGQKSERAQAIVDKFLADNPKLDKDLRLKILENADVIERAVKIRAKYAKN